MKISKSRWIISLIVVIFAINVPTFAYGQEPSVSKSTGNYEIVTPFFTNITLFQNVFYISTDGKASISVYLTARNVDSVKIDASLQQFKNGNWLFIDVYSSIGTYSLEYSKTDTAWDSSVAVQIWLEAIYEKPYFSDGSGHRAYRPISVNGKIISNGDPSQIEVTRMDLEVYTALGKFNLDHTWAAGSSGMEVYRFYKNYPTVGTVYGGSPSIPYYTEADYSPNFLGWINRVSLKRIPTGTTWEFQALISIGDGSFQ